MMGFLLLLGMLLGAQDTATVGRPVANMYSRAADDADVVSQAIYGTNVGVLERSGQWMKIRTPDGYTGWMAADALSSGLQKPYAETGRVAEVGSLFAHLYREPDVTLHRPLLTVAFESRLEIAAAPPESPRWLEVRLVNGQTAWIQRGDLSFRTEPMSIPEAIATARRFLGMPYTWGGTSSYGYDCSGFTQMICRRRGVVLPRDAGPQARWEGVIPVERDHLQAGDLLYFGKSMNKITHTGMYVGHGEFIHATTHEKPVVQISRLNDPYWTALLVCARRLK